MPGPLPKDPEQRHRRNKAATAATLREPDPGEVCIPNLPIELFPDDKPHDAVVRWWYAIWSSPMAGNWLPSDLEGLCLLAVLRHRFFDHPSATLAGEIRQQESRFGLSPLDRRRLEWRIELPRRPGEAPKPINSHGGDDDDDPRVFFLTTEHPR